MNSKTKLTKQIDANKRIVIYGFNSYGEEYFVKLFKTNFITGIYDINFKTMDIYVESPDKICEDDFDYIVVTVINDNSRKKVLSFFKQKEISENKIVLCNKV